MHQDSVLVDPASTTTALGEGSDSKRDSLQHNYSFSNQTTRQEQPGKRSDRSTGHVGIMIEDQQHGGDPGHGRVTHSHAQGGRGLAFEQGHSPVGSPIAAQSHAQDVLPPAVGHSTRGSHHSNMFQQGYSQYQGHHPPGAVLSRHLSLQLPPSASFLPPAPPPVAHSGSHGMHPSYALDGSLADSAPSQAREYTVPSQSNQAMGAWRSVPSSSQQSQYLHQGHQPRQQQHSPSQQSVAVPPPPIKYTRSPMRPPNMPQLSSQAMAYAQAQAQVQAQSQSQSQYRHPYHHGVVQSQHQFPPRTHRRSIQPLTLDQQQPKGGSFRFVRNPADLWPQKGSQKYRSIDDYGHSISVRQD